LSTLEQLKPIFQVSEFNELINQHLSLLDEITIEGEISELNISQNKWVFITVKDASSSVGIFGVLYQLRNIYALEVGMKVHVSGVPRLHQKSGRFSMHASRIAPAGEGAHQLAYEKLKNKLEAEGLFDSSHKRPLPRIPEHIVLLTAKDSQAYQDFVKVSRNRLPSIKLTHIAIQVQGDKAPESILTGLSLANKNEAYDLIVLTRGGGSLEDLSAFNDEEVARSIFASKLPVVSAIGHEGNITLAELVADKRASTPSNAAEIAVPDLEMLTKEIEQSCDRIYYQLKQTIQKARYKTQELSQFLGHSLTTKISTVKVTIDKLSSLSFRYSFLIDSYQKKTLQQKQLLRLYIERQLENLKSDYQATEIALHYLDSKHVLKRGFSLTRNQKGEIVSSIKGLVANSPIVTNLYDGTISSIIKETKTYDENTNKN